MNKDIKDSKTSSRANYKTRNGNTNTIKRTTPSKLKCGNLGIDCLIKN